MKPRPLFQLLLVLLNGWMLGGLTPPEYSIGSSAAVPHTYADPEGLCGGNTPCYTTFSAALSNVSVGGTVSIQGNFTGDLVINKNVTVDLSGFTIVQGWINLQTGTFRLTNELQSLGNWIKTGGTFDPSNEVVYLSNRGEQTIIGDFPFYDVSIDPTASVLVGANYLNVSNILWNGGVIRRIVPEQTVLTGGGPATFTDGINKKTLMVTSTGATSLGKTDLEVSMHAAPEACGSSVLPVGRVKRTFQITPENQTNVEATLRFYYDLVTESALSSLKNLNRVYYCDGSKWQAVEGTYYRGYDSSLKYYYVEISGITHFSKFALASDSVFLPSIIR